LAEKDTLSLKLPDGTVMTMVDHIAFSQDTSGTIYEIGEFSDSGFDLLQTPSVVYQSPMAVGQVVNTSGVFASGDTVLESYRVDAVERVSVPAGTWVAFKVTRSSQQRNALGQLIASRTQTEWVVPSLGIVKFQRLITDHESGISLTATYSLKTYQLTP